MSGVSTKQEVRVTCVYSIQPLYCVSATLGADQVFGAGKRRSFGWAE